MRALLNERREASALKARKQRDPDYINRKKGLAVLEREQASAKELQAAARRLEGVEARFSEDPDVIGGLGYIALRSGEHDKAERYFRRAELIDPEGRAKWRSLIKTAQYWGAIDKAKRALESSKGDDKKGGDDNPIQKAEEMIAEALKIDPNESVGWVVNADIAKKKGLTKKSEASYRRALKQEPLSSAALNGLINLYADQGHIRKALFIASGYTSAQQHVVEGRIERLSVRFFREEADQALRLGRIDQAKQRLESGLKKVPHAPWLHYDLARLLKEEGHPEKGAELFQVALKQYPNDVELKYAAALYLSSMDRNREAVVLLSEIEKTHMTEGIQVLYSKLLFNQVVLSVKHEEDHALKVAQLSRAEQHVGGDSGRALALAQLWAEMGEGDRASALMAPFLPNTASDAEREPSMSETVQMGMANLYLDLNKLDESQMLLDALLAAPKMREQEVKGQSPLFNFDLHYLAFKLSEKRRLIDNAVEHAHEAVRIAEALERDQYDDSLSKRAWAMSRLNAFMSEQREAEIVQIHAAVDYRFRSGDEGFSDLHAFTLPVEVRFPWQLNMLDAWFSRLFDRSSHLNTDSVSFSTAQGFFRAEYIDLESGYVDIVRNEREANEFGTLLLCGALCPVESIFQESDGVSFALGYDASNWRFDLGTTPLGFLVEDWVGGIEVEGTYNLFDWRVEVDKRPVTGSLISFAGTQDPNTGRIWGGVRKSGIEASASWDQGERYGWWGLVGWHRYTGQHVEDNRRFRVLSGGYRRILESDPFRFDAGLQLMWLRYDEDLGEFTFGHGGYYSPQRYVSLSVPLDLYGKKDRWSYLLRASLSIANSKDDTTPFYPNDPDLQLEAEQEAPFTDIEPFYLGGSDTRFGYALSGRFEYQFDERLFIGGVLQIERSEFYAPNWAQLWIRYYFEPSSRGINVPPKPIQPYMDF